MASSFKPRQNIWTCFHCWFMNTPKLTSCIACRKMRGTKPTIEAISNWKCSECEFENDHRTINCKVCRCDRNKITVELITPTYIPTTTPRIERKWRQMQITQGLMLFFVSDKGSNKGLNRDINLVVEIIDMFISPRPGKCTACNHKLEYDETFMCTCLPNRLECTFCQTCHEESLKSKPYLLKDNLALKHINHLHLLIRTPEQWLEETTS